MNEFYVRYIPEHERQRIEMLEPFDEYEVTVTLQLNVLFICLRTRTEL